jgi:hypothetical protein
MGPTSAPWASVKEAERVYYDGGLFYGQNLNFGFWESQFQTCMESSSNQKDEALKMEKKKIRVVGEGVMSQADFIIEQG